MGKGSVRVALFRRIVMLTGLVFGGNVIKKFEGIFFIIVCVFVFCVLFYFIFHFLFIFIYFY